MNRKQLTLLFIGVLVLGGLGLLVNRNQQSAWQSTASVGNQPVLSNFPLNDVAQIVIRQSGAELNLVKQDDLWRVRERANYPADFSTISDFLRKVWEMKAVQTLQVEVAELPRLELVEPGKGASSGTRVEFKDQGGKTIRSLLLGKKHTKEGGNSPMGGGGWSDGRYLLVAGDKQNALLVAEPFNNAEPKADAWLNKEFFKIENIRSVSVTSTNATNTWKLSRETLEGEWKLADLKPGELTDGPRASGLNGLLANPSFLDVVPGGKTNEAAKDKPLEAVLQSFDGFTYALKLTKQSEDEKYLLGVSVSVDLPKERGPVKDEKPEDKTRLDKEFQVKLEKLNEKATREKAFGNWNYLVNKYTIDTLLKPRSDFLAEKKEEPKKDIPPGEKDPAPPVLKPPAK